MVAEERNMTAENLRMKAARVALGRRQRDLAARVGMTEMEVSRIETGRAAVNTETKRRIAGALGKPTFELFDR